MREVLRSKSARWAGVVVLLAGGGAIFAATRGGGGVEKSAGSFEVRQTSLTFDASTSKNKGADGTLFEFLDLHNTGGTPSTYTLSSDASWLIFGSDVSAVVPRSADHRATIYADPRAVATTQESTLVVSSEGSSISIPVTLIPSGAPLSGSGIRAIPPSLVFGSESSAARVELTNLGATSLEWHAGQTALWVALEPTGGTLGAHARTQLSVAIDRSKVGEGNHEADLVISSAAGQTKVHLSVDVGPQPILDLPQTLLEFGRHRTGQTVRDFVVRNAGKQPLTYQVSNDRFYVYLTSGASGTVPPGGSATVTVTFDHTKSYYGDREFPLPVTSNGGSGAVRVHGITDTVGPKAKHEDMSFIHTHSDGHRYRHARADLTDEFGRVVSARVQYRICTGNPPAPPACTAWTLSEMHPSQGPTWEADAGPVPACTGRVGVYINWRIQAEDDLVNHQFQPGSSTFYNWIHCATPEN